MASWFQKAYLAVLGVLREQGEDFPIFPLGADNGVSDPQREILKDEEYVSIVLRSARIVNVRVLSSKFYACVQSRGHYLHLDRGRVEFQTVIQPSMARDIDKAHVDRVIALNKNVVGPVPYLGEMTLELGLFSVKSVDLAGDYIDLLTSLADKSGVAFLNAALPFVEPLRQGADLLFGNPKQSNLEIGLDTDNAGVKLKTGTYLLMRAPKGSVAPKDLKLDPADWKLVRKDGKAMADYPYVVFSIEASSERPDWMLIPELKAAWDAIGEEAKKQNTDNAEKLLKQFEIIAGWSPDLVPADARRLAKKAADKLPNIQKREGVSALTTGENPLGSFGDLDLYSKN